MKILALFISLTFVLSIPLLSYAGPGHDHGHDHGHSHGAPSKLDDKGLIAAASVGVTAIIQQKIKVEEKLLDGSWATILETAKSVSKKGHGYAIVKFNKDSEKALYILLSDIGEIYDANYSGEFVGLEN